ncbi:MAG: hypothetical protein IT381_18360 [Deltaproteobacteria bacterium]|nr:hypothetical protein [Deltaproteobacteria bacterium]
MLCRTAAAFLLIVTIAPAIAGACGVPGAGGPAGVTLCNLKDRKQLAAKPDRVGLRLSTGFAHSDTGIIFPGGDTIAIERSAASASLEYRVRDDLVLTATGGAVVRGSISGGVSARVLPGPLVALSLSWRILGAKPTEPLVLFGTTLSFVHHQTEVLFGAREPYTAFDLRVGLIVGKTFWDVFTPYAAFRLFGGPVFYRLGGQALMGGDLYHFQVGAGFSIAIARRLDLFFEGVPLGERALNAGVGVSL